MNYIRERLSAKLFLANLAVIIIGVIILAITIQLTVPAAFNSHLGMMANMNNGMGMGMGQGQGQGYGRTLFDNFRASMFQSLGYAVTASVLAALLVSWFLSRRIVAPVQTLSAASRSIAEGHYDQRVQVDGSDEIAQLATNFNQIHREADRLSRLVDDLQELSRVEAKAYSLDLRPVTVSNLVQTTVKRLAPQATAKRITLRSNLPADLPPLQADEDRVTQVLVNLVANAIQYTPEGGEVTISAAWHEGEVHISVQDTGIGIPPEHIANLFTRFYRVDKSRSRNAGGGSGIGLTIARHFVEAHGGRIWVESKGEGQGSVFTFSLKAAK